MAPGLEEGVGSWASPGCVLTDFLLLCAGMILPYVPWSSHFRTAVIGLKGPHDTNSQNTMPLFHATQHTGNALFVCDSLMEAGVFTLQRA